MQARQEYPSNHGAVEEREEQAMAAAVPGEPRCKPKRAPARRGRRNGMVLPTYGACNRTLLHMACETNKAEMATTLIKSGMDVNTTDKDGQSALHIAAQKGHTACVRVLLDCAACKVDAPRKESIMPSNNNNCSTEEGQTALQMAIDNQHTAVVYWLLYFGADPAMVNNNNNNNNGNNDNDNNDNDNDNDKNNNDNNNNDNDNNNDTNQPVSTITPAHALVNTAQLAIADTVAAQDKDTLEQRTHRVRVALGYVRLGSLCKYPKHALYAATGVPDVLIDETLATYIA